MYALVMRALSAGRLLTKYAVSRFGWKSIAQQTAGFIAIDGAINFAAKHSEWVNENKQAILASTIVASGAGNVVRAARKAIVGGVIKSGLFSTLKVVNSGAAIAKMRSSIIATELRNGFHFAFNNGADFVELTVQAGKLYFKHSGSKSAAVLLAGGFGATSVSSLLDDKLASMEQLAIVLSDILISEKEDELSELVNDFSPISLLQTGPRLLFNYIDSNPGFSEEMAVSILERRKSEVQYRHGDFTLFGFTDITGKEVFRINSREYVLAGDELILSPDSHEYLHSGLGEDGEGILAALTKFYSSFETQEDIDLYPIKDTERFISDVAVVPGYAVALVFDAETSEIKHRVAKSSLFDSASENMIDATEASTFEVIAAWFSEIVDEVMDEENHAKQPSSLNVKGAVTYMGKN